MAYEATWRKAIVHKDRILTDPKGTNIVFLPLTQDRTQVLMKSHFLYKLNKYQLQMSFLCSMECNKKDSCSAWCIVDSECRLTNFYISPQDGPEDSDHVTCYSRKRFGNHIVQATASSSDYSKSPSALTKGIFNFNWGNTVSQLRSGENSYMKFEFRSEIWVKTIRIAISSGEENMPNDQTEIRLGSSMPGGPTDFSQLELIGTFDDPQSQEWRTFTVDPRKKAKFFVILQKDETNLEIKFLEVFS